MLNGLSYCTTLFATKNITAGSSKQLKSKRQIQVTLAYMLEIECLLNFCFKTYYIFKFESFNEFLSLFIVNIPMSFKFT